MVLLRNNLNKDINYKLLMEMNYVKLCYCFDSMSCRQQRKFRQKETFMDTFEKPEILKKRLGWQRHLIPFLNKPNPLILSFLDKHQKS